MGEKTGIAWTDSTWNPVRGCTKVSAGCRNCYAETFAERWRGIPGHPFEQGFDLRLVPEALELPLRWKKPRRIFVNSMSDLFHEGVPEAFIAQVFSVMASCPQHTFQVLTKRPARMRDVVSRIQWHVGMAFPSWAPGHILTTLAALAPNDWVSLETGKPSERQQPASFTVPPNVWLGVSVEDQRAADERIPELLATPAAVRFLSCEPLLGPVDLAGYLNRRCTRCGGSASVPVPGGGAPCPRCLRVGQFVDPDQLAWVIVGGESGPGARPCEANAVRFLVRQCRKAGVPVFVKQLGAHVQDRNDAGFDGDTVYSWPMGTEVEHDQADTGYQGAPVRVRLLDRKGGVVTEWPADLRVQQFPEVPRG